MARIVRERAAGLRWEVEPAVFDQIAQLSRGVPRTGLRLLEAAWRTTRSQNAKAITTDLFARTIQLEGLDALGLDRTEQRYLQVLAEAEGRPVRLGVIADRLGLPPRTLASVIEPFLVREDLILRHDQGRELTSKGLEHTRQMRCRDE